MPAPAAGGLAQPALELRTAVPFRPRRIGVGVGEAERHREAAQTADRPARAVTRVEALLVQELLSGTPDGSVAKGLPRRTRQTARQRMYLRGWLADRYVPDFAALGRSQLGFGVARPYLDRQRETVRRWAARPEAVLVWSGASSVFGVFAARNEEDFARMRGELGEQDALQTEYWISAPTARPSVPVYFDFEGLWARFAGLPGSRTYPQPLPGRSVEEGPGLAPSAEAAALRWIRHPFLPDSPHRPPERDRGILTGIADRRSVREGHVRFRTFLQPATVASWVAGFPPECIFVHGTMRPGTPPEGLFHRLVEEFAVHPFLFVTVQQELLLGLVGGTPNPRDAAPDPPASGTAAAFERLLSRVGVVREPLSTLEAVVDHRYDRPFDSPAENGSPSLPP